MDTFGETRVPYFADTDHIYYPEGVAVDGDGNLWVAEMVGGRALKYAPDGSFLMSIGRAGSIEVDENHFCEPSDLAQDGDGNVWVTDRCSSRAVKYDSDGNYLMQLGVMWESGSDNDHFTVPIGVALDSAGNLYVADVENHRIQIFDASGVYSATIGVTDEPGSDNDHFQNPYRVTIDDADNLYVADMNNHRVQIFDAGHNYVATLGITGECGDLSDNERLCLPTGVAVDASRIYVAESGNNRVQIFDRNTHTYLTIVGTGYGSGDYEFGSLRDVAMDAAGNLYAADGPNHRVQKFDSTLAYVGTIGVTGVPYLTDGYHYNGPFSVAVSSAGNIGIVEPEGHRFILLDASGSPLFTIGEAGVQGSDNDHFANPQGVAFGADGRIYMADAWNNRIQIFEANGAFDTTVGSGSGTGSYEFNDPRGVAVDSSGNLYVADQTNHRVQVYDSDHVYVATLGVTGEPGSDNDHFNYPVAVEVDDVGNIYVVDHENHRVQKFNSSFTWGMTLGTTGECGDSFEYLCSPSGVAVDRLGRIFVADSGNTRVQVFAPDGAYLTTIGGDHGERSGSLFWPTGVDVDASGNVYIADTGNDRIQKFAPGVPGWRQVNINGFGERLNVFAIALAPFNGQLFVGTGSWSGNGAQLWRQSAGSDWSAVMSNGFGDPDNWGITALAEFNGQLYAGTTGANDAGGEVWRSSTGDSGSWNQVASASFGDPTNGEVFRFTVFNGQIYATLNSYTDSHGGEIWRSSSGDSGSWSRVVGNGFGVTSNDLMYTLEVFDGHLYAGTGGSGENGVAQVWRSSTGNQGSWSQVNVNGFGEAANTVAQSLAAFHGYLYAGTSNGTTGGQIWRCDRCDTAGDWVQVVDDGIGNVNNQILAMLVVNEMLYAVTDNGATGLEVWLTGNGTSWKQIGFAGLGDSNNYQALSGESLTVFDDALYIATMNPAHGGEVWQWVGYPVFMPAIER